MTGLPDDRNTEGNDLSDGVTHYWATEADATARTGIVRVADEDADTVIVDIDATDDETGGGNRIVKYDSNDQFNVGPVGAPVAVSLDSFESGVGEGNSLFYDLSADPVPGVNVLRNEDGTVDVSQSTCHAA